MILGVVWAQKRYRCVKYLFVLMITMGVALFMYKPSVAAAHTDLTDSHTFGFGECLLVSSYLIIACKFWSASCWMWSVARDVAWLLVCVCVCVCVCLTHWWAPTRTAESTNMLYGLWTRGAQGTIYYIGPWILLKRGTFVGYTGTCLGIPTVNVVSNLCKGQHMDMQPLASINVATCQCCCWHYAVVCDC